MAEQQQQHKPIANWTDAIPDEEKAKCTPLQSLYIGYMTAILHSDKFIEDLFGRKAIFFMDFNNELTNLFKPPCYSVEIPIFSTTLSEPIANWFDTFSGMCKRDKSDFRMVIGSRQFNGAEEFNTGFGGLMKVVFPESEKPTMSVICISTDNVKRELLSALDNHYYCGLHVIENNWVREMECDKYLLSMEIATMMDDVPEVFDPTKEDPHARCEPWLKPEPDPDCLFNIFDDDWSPMT